MEEFVKKKYFFSFSSTFSSFLEGKLSLEELKEGYFVFGPVKEHVLSQNGRVHVLASRFNKEKLKIHETEWIPETYLDELVLQKWLSFKGLLKELNQERVIWKEGKNYPRKCYIFLKDGHEVFWNGCWQKLENFNYLSEE